MDPRRLFYDFYDFYTFFMMYGTEAYILFSLANSSESLDADPVFGIVSIQSG